MSSLFYRMAVIGKEGMYSYGDLACSPHLAKVAVGNLTREVLQPDGTYKLRRLAIYGMTGPYDPSPVMVDAEQVPGEWTIGELAPYTRKET